VLSNGSDELLYSVPLYKSIIIYKDQKISPRSSRSEIASAAATIIESNIYPPKVSKNDWTQLTCNKISVIYQNQFVFCSIRVWYQPAQSRFQIGMSLI
jgi:hypothetical protein